MADATPPDPPTGQEPPSGQGQEPNGDPASQSPEDGTRVYDKAYVQRLRRESEGLRDRLDAAEALIKEREDAEKTELELAQSELSTLRQQVTDYQLRDLRYQVAAEKGLGLDAVKFLTGTTREEIELRAEELADLLKDKGQTKPAAGSFDGGARTTAPEKGTPEEEHNKLLMKALGRGREFP